MNKYFYLVWSLLLLFIISSCTNPIEPNRRIAFDISITDNNGGGLSEIDANIGMYGNSFFNSNEQFIGLTGVGATDAQGNAHVISLKPRRTETNVLALLINTENPNQPVVNPDYGSIIFRVDSLEDNQLTFPSTFLREVANVSISVTNTSGTEDEIDFTVEVENRNQLRSFPLSVNDDFEVFNTLRATRTLNAMEGQESLSLELPTLQNSLLIFTYFFRNDEGESTPVTLEIPINEAFFTYEFEY